MNLETGHGVTLFTFGVGVASDERKEVLHLFERIGRTNEVPEDLFRIYEDLTS